MFVPSRKMTVTWERPYRDRDRVSTRPGSPAMAVSIGNVTCRSISSGGSPSTTVFTWTCTFVMSGTASIGRRARFRAPNTATATVPTAIQPRWRIENRRIRSRDVWGFGRGGSVLMTPRLILELCFDEERVPGDDPRAALQAGQDLRCGSIASPWSHRLHFEPGRVCPEDSGPTPHAHNGVLGNGDGNGDAL